MKYSRVFNNAKWIIICKIIQSLLQLLIGMFSARYLGPENYGLINYAASIVAVASPFMKMGLDAILVREFTDNSKKEGEIIGSSLLLNIFSGMVCMLGVWGFSTVSSGNERVTVLVCVLYSTSLLFSAMEMIQYWFQYKLLSKYSSLIMLAAYVLVSGYKIYLLVMEKSVYWFAVSHSLEYGLIAVLLFVAYFKMGGKLSFSFSRMLLLAKRGKYFLISSLMLVVIQNTDHIMLTMISGEAENGFYSAAITCTIVVQFVYTAIIDSFRPIILENKKNNDKDYYLNVSRLYSITVYLSVAQSIVFTIFAKLIVFILYGKDYMNTVPVLQILVWYLAFSVMGLVRNVWILAEGKEKNLTFINLFGAVFNICFNAVLIPFFGASGAAFASLLTQIAANLILGFIWKPLRENNKLIIKALDPRFAVSEVKSIIRLLTKK